MTDKYVMKNWMDIRLETNLFCFDFVYSSRRKEEREEKTTAFEMAISIEYMFNTVEIDLLMMGAERLYTFFELDFHL